MCIFCKSIYSSINRRRCQIFNTQIHISLYLSCEGLLVFTFTFVVCKYHHINTYDSICDNAQINSKNFHPPLSLSLSHSLSRFIFAFRFLHFKLSIKTLNCLIGKKIDLFMLKCSGIALFVVVVVIIIATTHFLLLCIYMENRLFLLAFHTHQLLPPSHSSLQCFEL